MLSKHYGISAAASIGLRGELQHVSTDVAEVYPRKPLSSARRCLGCRFRTFSDRVLDRSLRASEARLRLRMDTDGVCRSTRSSPSRPFTLPGWPSSGSRPRRKCRYRVPPTFCSASPRLFSLGAACTASRTASRTCSRGVVSVRICVHLHPKTSTNTVFTADLGDLRVGFLPSAPALSRFVFFAVTTARLRAPALAGRFVLPGSQGRTSGSRAAPRRD